jgi:hypothetical protein
MFGPSPYSAWKTDDLDAKIGPLWGEKDEKKPIDGWKAVDAYIAEQAMSFPSCNTKAGNSSIRPGGCSRRRSPCCSRPCSPSTSLATDFGGRSIGCSSDDGADPLDSGIERGFGTRER